MALRYFILIYSLCFVANSSEVPDAGSSEVTVATDLLNRLIEGIEYKNGQIDSLLDRVDRLEQRERELQERQNELERQNEDLRERLESLDQSSKVEQSEQNEEKAGDIEVESSATSHKTLHRIRASSGGNLMPLILKSRQAPPSGYEGTNIAFFAGITSHLQHQGKDQLIVFDKVITNIGDAYNAHSGDFRAPTGGTYVFSVNLMAYGSHTTHYYIAKNGTALAWLYLRGTESPYASTSQTVVLDLNKGDDVSIKNFDTDEMLYGSMYSTFSGFLLREKFSDVVIG